MPKFPFRQVGAGGIITDQSPYDLDETQWSNGRNVRFSKASVERWSLFKDRYSAVSHPITEAKVPVGGGIYLTPDSARPFTVNKDYSINEWTPGGLVDVTPDIVDWTSGSSTDRVTTSFIGGVTYVNRASSVPIYRDVVATEFAAIPGWPSTDRCKALRPFKDVIFAIGVTKAGVSNPAMVRNSDVVFYGSPPANWDITDPASLAEENVLNDATGPLVDGLGLGDTFMLYSQKEVFAVDYLGSSFRWNYRKLFSDDGVMSVNCVVEADNKHFVFGTKDIYIHDGITRKSITDDRVRDFIYDSIDFDLRSRCFVTHDFTKSEIIFAYPSLLDEARSSATSDCNFAAVFNYLSNTWTFVDLPFVVGAVALSTDPAATWEDLTSSWDENNASWASARSLDSALIGMISAGQMTATQRPRVLALDDPNIGKSDAQLLSDYRPASFIERTGIDLDAIGAEISGRKLVKALYPQATLGSPDSKFYVQFGRSIFSSGPITWEAKQFFNPDTNYKVDTRNTGRYLALRFGADTQDYWKLSGYDIDVMKIAGR